ncbi:cation transporter [Nanchangia anserum]|uniref:Cation transporter n=1 Tax=Nanchangia anserum TaxID=2692125 RepID=A0A8I0KRP8_9ACTO|nr:cation transporter [Nanchangia anserum]MBD3689617.1 cation transporter [Nanchangia anserum]QOX81799.1 cation transporter [Nanchangia anserum]
MFGSRTLTVSMTGLTCGHCVQHVSDALSRLPGVKKVSVDLVKDGVSTAKVSARGAVDDAAITAAVTEAGYAVTSIER